MKLTWKPIMAGILDIVGGAIGMVGGLYIVGLTSLFQVLREDFHIISDFLLSWEQAASGFIAVPFIFLFFGSASFIGGIYSLQRRMGPRARAGPISSCIVFPFFGLPAIIITALARDEFNQ